MKIAALITMCVVTALTTTASAGTRQPSLRLVDDDPLTVQGARFASSEPVRITVSKDGRAIARRTVRAGAGGGFVARFATVTLHRCDGGFAITARGGGGRFAAAKVPQADCPPSLDAP
jgi:hypothetical protein